MDNMQASKTFSCPMHPEVRSDKEGSCPKCGMRLLPAEVQPRAGEQSNLGMKMTPRYFWIIVVVIIAFAAGAWLFGGNTSLGFLPFAIILLLCPIAMMFMMRGKSGH